MLQLERVKFDTLCCRRHCHLPSGQCIGPYQTGHCLPLPRVADKKLAEHIHIPWLRGPWDRETTRGVQPHTSCLFHSDTSILSLWRFSLARNSKLYSLNPSKFDFLVNTQLFWNALPGKSQMIIQGQGQGQGSFEAEGTPPPWGGGLASPAAFSSPAPLHQRISIPVQLPGGCLDGTRLFFHLRGSEIFQNWTRCWQPGFLLKFWQVNNVLKFENPFD